MGEYLNYLSIDNISGLWLIILIVAVFTAGYIDSIAGGGGLIQLPILIATGMPTINAVVINKTVSIVGTFIAVLNYSLNKSVQWKLLLFLGPICLFTSFLGGKLVLITPEYLLNIFIFVFIGIALLALLKNQLNSKTKRAEFSCQETNKNLQAKTSASKLRMAKYIAPIGLYDGYIGPGTGTYLTICLHSFCKLNLLSATSTTKPLNLITNMGALIVFFYEGAIIWQLAIILSIFNALGSFLGSKQAISKGSVFIKYTLIFVVALMMIANIYKVFT